MSNPISLTTVQAQIDAASQAQILTMLAEIAAWQKNYHVPWDMRRADEANAFVTAINASEVGALDRARRWLHRKCAEDVAAQGGFENV